MGVATSQRRNFGLKSGAGGLLKERETSGPKTRGRRMGRKEVSPPIGLRGLGQRHVEFSRWSLGGSPAENGFIVT